MSELFIDQPLPTEKQLACALPFVDHVLPALRAVPGSIQNPLTPGQITVYEACVAQDGLLKDTNKVLGITLKTLRNQINKANSALHMSGVENGILVAEHHGFIAPFQAGFNDDNGANNPLLKQRLLYAQGLVLGVPIGVISDVLEVSERTAINYRQMLYEDLNVHRRIGLIRSVIASGQVLTARRILGHLGLYEPDSDNDTSNSESFS